MHPDHIRVLLPVAVVRVLVVHGVVVVVRVLGIVVVAWVVVGVVAFRYHPAVVGEWWEVFA